MDFNKPRVAIYYFVVPQTGFRNDGPPLFANAALRSILNGNMNLADDGGNVVHLWPIRTPKDFGTFDLHLLVDHGEDVLGVPLDFKIPSPSAYWVSDAHLGFDYRLKRAREMDFVFCCQKRAAEEFIAAGIPRERVFWLPHAVEPTCYKPFPIIEKYDWSFIGHLNSPQRVELLDRFCREIPNFYLGWRMPEVKGWNVLEDASKKFCQSRIVLNQNIKDDINMRTFEALASRRFLLTSDIPTLGDLFTDKKHLVTYRSIDEAVELARHYLLDDGERRRIAEEGYQEVINKHTYVHRMSELLKKSINYEPKEAVLCR